MLLSSWARGSVWIMVLSSITIINIANAISDVVVPPMQELMGDNLNDAFGTAVALSGDGMVLAVGAKEYDHDNPGVSDGDVDLEYNLGQVQVFRRNVTTSEWTTWGNPILGQTEQDRSGYSVALNQDGTVVVIGGIERGNGHVRAFAFNTTADDWSPRGQTMFGQRSGDYFGKSVDIDNAGSRIVVGAPRYDLVGAGKPGTNIGHTRVYEYTTMGVWQRLGADMVGEVADDESGWSVQLSGDGQRVATSAVLNEKGAGWSGEANVGHVRTYQWNNATTAWQKLGRDLDGSNYDDQLGHSIALSRDGLRLAALSRKKNFVWTYDSASTSSSAGFVRTGGIGGFGEMVALSADGMRMAVTHTQQDDPSMTPPIEDAGLLRILEWGGTQWVPLLDIYGTAEGDQAGYALAMSDDGTTVAVGAPYSAAIAHGAVRVYDLTGITAPPTDAPTHSPTGAPSVAPTAPPTSAPTTSVPTTVPTTMAPTTTAPTTAAPTSSTTAPTTAPTTVDDATSLATPSNRVGWGLWMASTSTAVLLVAMVFQ